MIFFLFLHFYEVKIHRQINKMMIKRKRKNNIYNIKWFIYLSLYINYIDSGSYDERK